MLIQPYVILFILFVFEHIYSVPIATTNNGPLWGPWRGVGGGGTRIGPPYPRVRRKRRLIIWRFLGITVKRLALVLVLGRAREPYEMSMAWEPDRRSNFFFFCGPPAYLYNWNIVECDVKQPISLTHAPIMKNKRFLSIHKIQIVCQYVHLTDIRERQSCHSVVGAKVNASFFYKCILHKALLVHVYVAEIITWTLELQHN